MLGYDDDRRGGWEAGANQRLSRGGSAWAAGGGRGGRRRGRQSRRSVTVVPPCPPERPSRHRDDRRHYVRDAHQLL